VNYLKKGINVVLTSGVTYKGTLVPVQVTKIWWSGCRTPLTLCLGPRWKCVTLHAPKSFSHFHRTRIQL